MNSARPLWIRAGLAASALLVGAATAPPARANDGYDLWLGPQGPTAAAAKVEVIGTSRTLAIAAEELRKGLPREATPVLLARAGEPALAPLKLATDQLGNEGYLVHSVTLSGQRLTIVTGNTDVAVLYGAFALLRHARAGGDTANLTLASTPRIPVRVLDHWDNLDGSVERGYAGQSLWDWWTLPDYKDPRYADYARANASIGINGVVLNNVNAKADSLSAAYIAKAAALADVFRPYGLRVYLSARFSAPMELGGLKTADPRNPAAAAWWQAKADEIYRAIPDFGGFLVKANSEGQPGPRDYGASHADGANMLAAALAPHGGVVMWRAFVYAETDPTDRASQAYAEFKPLDGKFSSNVIVQVKNGPIDFQPREPMHPLFGAMPATRLAAEFQVTKEYLGFATHLAYLGPLFAEALDTPTERRAGETMGSSLAAIAGVANVGRDRDWSGSTFNQANWYAFGRLAWDFTLDPRAIAREWTLQTFGLPPAATDKIVAMMMRSREAVVDYTGPFGLAHLFGSDHHYGPGPWIDDLKRPEWNPVYYHRADRNGIGFDRTARGSNTVAQYAPGLAARLARPETTPPELLLWFHHVPWTYPMPGGETLWQAMVRRYDHGVAEVDLLRREWASLKPQVDAERWTKTDAYLGIQQREARWWRDASLAYWMSINGLALPAGVRKPDHDLSWYKQQHFPFAPGGPR